MDIARLLDIGIRLRLAGNALVNWIGLGSLRSIRPEGNRGHSRKRADDATISTEEHYAFPSP
jgi:hypothetical protein